MQIEILYVIGCPHVDDTRSRIRAALHRAGRAASVHEVAVTDADDAARLGMRGSPTIVLDGHDPFSADTDPSLSCRLYRTTDGIDGVPTVEQLVEVIAGSNGRCGADEH
jgi:hypothetical protein